MLSEICCVSFFRGLSPADILRRFGPRDALIEEMSIGELWVLAEEFASETGGGDGGGYVGVVQADGWSVAIEPLGWYAVLEEYRTVLSRGCEMVAVSRHAYADDTFVYAVDGVAVTHFIPRWLPRRWGSDPNRLDHAMRKVGLPTDPMEDERDAAQDGVAASLALVAEITGVPFTRGLWDFPLFAGPVAQRFA